MKKVWKRKDISDKDSAMVKAFEVFTVVMFLLLIVLTVLTVIGE